MSDGLDALIALLTRRAGMPLALEHLRSTPWASITFAGARHRLTLRLEGPGAGEAAERMTEALDHAELDFGRHILVDLALIDREYTEDRARVVIDALTVRDG